MSQNRCAQYAQMGNIFLKSNVVSKQVRTVRTDWPNSKTLPMSQNRCARYAQMGKIKKE